MLEFFKNLFRSEPSGATARERLRLVLLSDHLALAPEVVESLKTDLFEVISKYVEIDRANCDVTFEQRDREVAMLANIPILSMKGRPPAPAPPPPEPPPPSPPLLDPAPLSASVTAEPETPAVEPPAPKPRRKRRRRANALAAPAPT